MRAVTVGARRDAREAELRHLAVERAAERVDDLRVARAAFGGHVQPPRVGVGALRSRARCGSRRTSAPSALPFFSAAA